MEGTAAATAAASLGTVELVEAGWGAAAVGWATAAVGWEAVPAAAADMNSEL